MALLARGEPVRQHPWLFLTTADVSRAKEAIGDNGVFAVLAHDLIERARTNSVDKLPPLERQWWETARLKPWKEIYPEVNHHTGNVPRRWATLALDCAQASLFRNTPNLAVKGKEVLLRLSDYTFEFEHFDVGMNYTAWGVLALEAYDILYDRFTADERTRMDAFFQRMLAAVQKNDRYWVEKEPGGFINNHYAWHKLCYVMMGAFYNETKLIDEALHGPKGIAFLMENGFKDDGLWVEGSIPYQCVATAPLVKAAELLENFRAATTNKDAASLYALKNSKGVDLVQSYKALLPLLWPDRTLPAIGDAYGEHPHIATRNEFEILFRRFRDPSFGWLIADHGNRSATALLSGVPNLQPVSAPAQFSKVWPEMGYIALRSNEGTNYWTGHGWTAFATFSNRPIHNHADKLSVSLFADGDLWLPDIEELPAAEHVFSSEVQSQLNRNTICHNTVLVDGENQHFPRQKLQLLDFSAGPEVKRAIFGDLRGQLYGGVRQLRTVIATTNYVVDFFEVQADKPRQIDWVTHVSGRSIYSSAVDPKPIKFAASAPWSFLLNPSTAKAGTHYVEKFSASKKPNSTFRLDLQSDTSMDIVNCDFPVVEKANPPTIPMRMARVHTDHVWFLAVYRVDAGESVSASVVNERGDEWTIKIGEAVYLVPHLSHFQGSGK